MRLWADPIVPLGEGAAWLRGFALEWEDSLLDAIQEISAVAPFRHMITPGGFRMSVAMTNAGTYGWVTDRKGYRYSPTDPESGTAWPAMPPPFLTLAEAAAAATGFSGYRPDACLINRYQSGAKMSPHQDRDEADLRAPIVSVSLGLPAVFQWGGLRRADPYERIPLEHGDVVVWGGPSRMRYHGVMPVRSGAHPRTGECRLNLTFRRAH